MNLTRRATELKNTSKLTLVIGDEQTSSEFLLKFATSGRDTRMVRGHGCTTLFKNMFIRNQYVVSKRQSVCVLYNWYIHMCVCVFFYLC